VRYRILCSSLLIPWNESKQELHSVTFEGSISNSCQVLCFASFFLRPRRYACKFGTGTELAPPSAWHHLTGHRSGNVSRAAQTYGLGCSQCFPTEKRKMIFIAYADLNHTTLPVLVALGYLEVRQIS
jgi:hypothetical protein